MSDSYSYSSDYEVIGKLKQFADRYGICVLIVHHTRKQPAGDSFEMISGTTGLLGCADGALLMQKEKRTDTKDHIIRTKLLPYFGRLKMCNITAQQIITWQNEMLNHKDEQGKPYSPVYLKTVHNQLSAIFNHAVRYAWKMEPHCPSTAPPWRTR